MRALVLLTCYHRTTTTDWSPVITALPGIFWGVIALVTLFFVLKYVVSPIIANRQERKIKADAFENEKFWYLRSMDEKDYKEVFENKISNLEKEIDKLSKELDKEKKDREKTLKEERLKAEHAFYKKVVDAFYQDKKQ